MIWVHGQRLLEVLTDGIAAHETCRATSWSFKSRGAMFLSNDEAVQPPSRTRRHYMQYAEHMCIRQVGAVHIVKVRANCF